MVDCIGLENRRTERFREFESHLFRQRLSEYVLYRAFLFLHTQKHTQDKYDSWGDVSPLTQTAGLKCWHLAAGWRGLTNDLFRLPNGVIKFTQPVTPPYPHSPFLQLVPSSSLCSMFCSNDVYLYKNCR